MTTLRISIPSHIDVPDLESMPGRVVGRLVGLGEVADTRHDLLIPVGRHDRFAEVDVAPGPYLVEATLPSGQVLNHEFEAAGGRQQVDLSWHQSPHEWLGWQVLCGNVQGVDNYVVSFGSETERPTVQALLDPGFRYGLPGSDGLSWSLLFQELSARRQDSSDLSGLGDPGPAFLGPTLEVEPSLWDDATALYRFAPNGTLNDSELPYRSPVPTSAGGYNIPAVRHVAVVDHDELRAVAWLPIPWFSASSLTEQEVEVVVRRDDTQGFPSVAVGLPDDDLGVALSYMMRGDLPAAAQLYDAATASLFDKFVNPLAAAGGGYVLVATDGLLQDDAGASEPAWYHWIENLANYFPWLPDGQIQLAWLKLRNQARREHVTEARAALVEAFRRGIPLYSTGLRWLLDGLTLFVDDGDRELRRTLDPVQAVARHVDLDQPFTVIRFDQP